ncbi:hypothetical protein MRX96_035041 [Rhipicephalus microplus]
MRHFVSRGCPLRDTPGAPGVPVQDGHPMNSLPGKGGAREETAAPFELAPAYKRSLITAADRSRSVSDARGRFYALWEPRGAAGVHADSSSWKGRERVGLRSHEEHGEDSLGSNREISAWHLVRLTTKFLT